MGNRIVLMDVIFENANDATRAQDLFLRTNSDLRVS